MAFPTMKSAFCFFFFVLSAMSVGFGQTITKGDILKTLDHIQKLSQQTKTELAKAQSDYQVQGVALQNMTESANKWRAEASRNARQRDVVLIAWALFASAYLGTFFAGAILREFPTPWNFIGVCFAYGITGIMAYGIGRLLLEQLARFIP